MKRLLFSLLLTLPIVAQDAIVTDRPGFHDGARVLRGRRIQLESGYEFRSTSSEKLHTMGQAVLRYSINARFEARLGATSFVRGHERHGFDDLKVGAKWQVNENPNGTIPRIGVLAWTSIPTGSREFGADEMQPAVEIVGDWNLSSRVAVTAGCILSSIVDEATRYGTAGGTLSVSMTDRISGYLQGHVGFENDEAAYTGLGLAYVITKRLQWDVNTAFGLNKVAADFAVGTGFGISW